MRRTSPTTIAISLDGPVLMVGICQGLFHDVIRYPDFDGCLRYHGTDYGHTVVLRTKIGSPSAYSVLMAMLDRRGPTKSPYSGN